VTGCTRSSRSRFHRSGSVKNDIPELLNSVVHRASFLLRFLALRQELRDGIMAHTWPENTSGSCEHSLAFSSSSPAVARWARPRESVQVSRWHASGLGEAVEYSLRVPTRCPRGHQADPSIPRGHQADPSIPRGHQADQHDPARLPSRPAPLGDSSLISRSELQIKAPAFHWS